MRRFDLVTALVATVLLVLAIFATIGMAQGATAFPMLTIVTPSETALSATILSTPQIQLTGTTTGTRVTWELEDGVRHTASFYAGYWSALITGLRADGGQSRVTLRAYDAAGNSCGLTRLITCNPPTGAVQTL